MDSLQQELIEDFSFYNDWTEKYEYIIESGKTLSPMNPVHKTEENKVRGCQSHVWLFAEMIDGKIHFQGDSEALIVKGLVYFLLKIFNEKTPDEVLATEPYFIEHIGLSSHLSPTRSNGLASMVKQIKNYAFVFQSQQKNEAKSQQEESKSVAESTTTNSEVKLDSEEMKEKIIDALHTIFDPEIPVDIYELGLIYKIDVIPINHVYIEMTLTSPACPVAETLPQEVQDKVKEIPGIQEVQVEVVFDPPWHQDMMSEAAQLELGFM